MLELVFKVLGAGLEIWASKEKTKYVDELIQLKKDFDEEFSKPVGARDNLRMDRIERELRILGETFASAVGTAGTRS